MGAGRKGRGGGIEESTAEWRESAMEWTREVPMEECSYLASRVRRALSGKPKSSQGEVGTWGGGGTCGGGGGGGG